MSVIKKFNKFINESLSQIEIDEKMNILRNKYSDSDVAEMIDEQIPEYLGVDWQDEYDNQYEAYCETGRGEAESDVINTLMKEVGVDYDEELRQSIVDEYDINEPI